MGHKTCCVVNCKNNGRNSSVHFYRFPTLKYKIEQRKRWIAAVRRENADGSPWSPKPDDVICSAHFVNNEKSDEPLSPSYIPVIFPVIYHAKKINEIAASNRHKRYKELLKKRKISNSTSQVFDENSECMNSLVLTEVCTSTDYIDASVFNEEAPSRNMDEFYPRFKNQECQAETFINHKIQEYSFTIERFKSDNAKNEVGIQTDMNIPSSNVIVFSRKKFHDKLCGTDQTFADASVGTDSYKPGRTFSGFSSIRKSSQLSELAGVSMSTFNIFLKMMKIRRGKASDIPNKDQLLIFFMKLKTGLSYSALGVIFGVHRVTVSNIFTKLLKHFAVTTKDLVFWPRKCDVQATMPQCFKDKYSDTRCIIDCTEFRIQIPSKLENRVWCYSGYKHGFTGKLLVAITPSGFICFLSKVAGGRKSDPQITMESGLINLLEDGDVVLADKGFPEIKSAMDKTGKKVMLVMPPFLRSGTVFTQEETEKTHQIASVHVHVERIMQRLRVYKILDQVPHNLFKMIDNIVHVCSVLVNFQPPIFAEKEEDE